MPQCLGNDGHIHRRHEGERSPCMACHIRGKRFAYPRLLPQYFQHLIIIAEFPPVLPVGGIFILRSKKRENIAAVVRLVAIDYLLHARFQLDLYELIGFAAVIGKNAIRNLRFLQESHIHEGHAAGIETEQENIAYQLHERPRFHLYVAQFIDVRFFYRTFPGAGYARKHILERFFLLRKSLFYRLVINGAQGAHVAGKRILAYSFSLKPGSVSVYQPALHIGKGNIFSAMKFKKRTQGGSIVTGCAVAVHPAGTHNFFPGKRGKTSGSYPGTCLFLFSLFR